MVRASWSQVRKDSSVLLVCALMIAAATTACTQPATPDSGTPGPRPQTSSLSDLSGLTVKAAIEELDALGISEATVVFPSELVTLTVDATYLAGVQKPSHIETHTVPARVLALPVTATDHYVVTSQSIAAGEFLGTGSLELTVAPAQSGVHSWLLEGHAAELERSSATPCFECHEETSCSQCHLAMLE